MFSTIRIGEIATSNLDLFNCNFTCSVLGVTGVAPGIRADGDGKEFEGLARAFEYAGARALVLQLWETYAEPTELFFETFYNEASLSEDLAMAFRSTLAKVRRKYPNPFCWAPFVLRGQNRPVGADEDGHIHA